MSYVTEDVCDGEGVTDYHCTRDWRRVGQDTRVERSVVGTTCVTWCVKCVCDGICTVCPVGVVCLSRAIDGIVTGVLFITMDMSLGNLDSGGPLQVLSSRDEVSKKEEGRRNREGLGWVSVVTGGVW